MRIPGYGEFDWLDAFGVVYGRVGIIPGIPSIVGPSPISATYSLNFRLVLDKEHHGLFVQIEYGEWMNGEFKDACIFAEDADVGIPCVEELLTLPRPIRLALMQLSQKYSTDVSYIWAEREELHICMEGFKEEIRWPSRLLEALGRKIINSIKHSN